MPLNANPSSMEYFPLNNILKKKNLYRRRHTMKLVRKCGQNYITFFKK